MRADLHITRGLIERRYYQGLDSIIRLVNDLEARIADLTVLQVSDPQRLARKQTAEIKRLEQIVCHKDAELVQAHQLNRQLQQRIRELEQTLAAEPPTTVPHTCLIVRDSHNSNQPPSLDPPWTKPKRTRSLRKRSGLAVGGQPGHKGSTLRQTTAPNRIIVYQAKECPECGASLAAASGHYLHKRQVFEIENGSLSVTEHRLAAQVCPLCGTISRTIPFGGQSSGAIWSKCFITRSLSAFVSTPAAVARTQEAMRDLFGCSISQASIQRAARLCSEKLIRCEQRIKTAIRESQVIGADETGIRVNGANHWVHVARTETLTHLAAHSKRGRAAFEAIGILNQFKGTLVRDGWFSYKWFGQCRHSLCNAHLLRDLTFIGEAYPMHEGWTSALAKLLIDIKEAIAAAQNSSQTQLESRLQQDFSRRYDALIAQAEEAVRGSPTLKVNGLSASKLLKRFITNKVEVLRFMTDFAIPFDNNGAERDLRMLKLQQKIAGCFRTAEGVTTFCRVRSYLSSARKQGQTLLPALEHALKGKPLVLI